MDKTCISCGMPMRGKEDYPKGDTTKNYCTYCARPDGSLKSYDEALDGMAAFLVRTQGLDAAVARTTAKSMMAKLPAWSGR